VQFYILVPFFYLLGRKYCVGLKSSVLCLLGVIGLGLLNKLGMYFLGQSDWFKVLYFYSQSWYAPLISNLDLFLAGFLTNPLILFLRSHLSANRPKKIKYFNVRLLKILALLLMLWLYAATAQALYEVKLHPITSPIPAFGWQAMTAIVTVFFIFSFEFSTDNRRSLKLSLQNILRNPWRSFEILGILSYGVYLWHVIILGQLPQFITMSQLPLGLFVTKVAWTLGLSSILAVITYYIVEMPAARYKLFQRKS
jgi:peptidoglycan/LPS O-acetylase OafA/YrhL